MRKLHMINFDKNKITLIAYLILAISLPSLLGKSWAQDPKNQKIRPSALIPQEETLFNNPSNTLPAAFRNGRLRYFVLADDTKHISQISFDFETALEVWVLSFQISSIELVRVNSIEDADLVLNVSAKALHPKGWQSSGAHAYFSNHKVRKDKIIPVIELQSAEQEIEWVTIQSASEKEAIAWSRKRGVQALTPIQNILGKPDSPKAVAAYILKNKSNIYDGRSVKLLDKKVRLVFGTLLHELGHVFGLDDLYDHSKNVYRIPKYRSIMGDLNWRSLYPTAIDIKRVQRGLSLKPSACANKIIGNANEELDLMP